MFENSVVDLLGVSGFGFFCLVLNRSSVFKNSLRLFSAEVVPWFLHRVWKCCRTNKIEYTLNRAELFHVLDVLFLKFRSVSEGLNWLEREIVKMSFLSDFLEAVQNGTLE